MHFLYSNTVSFGFGLSHNRENFLRNRLRMGRSDCLINDCKDVMKMAVLVMMVMMIMSDFVSVILFVVMLVLLTKEVIHVVVIVGSTVFECDFEITRIQSVFLDSGNSNFKLLIGQTL